MNNRILKSPIIWNIKLQEWTTEVGFKNLNQGFELCNNDVALLFYLTIYLHFTLLTTEFNVHETAINNNYSLNIQDPRSANPLLSYIFQNLIQERLIELIAHFMETHWEYRFTQQVHGELNWIVFIKYLTAMVPSTLPIQSFQLDTLNFWSYYHLYLPKRSFQPNGSRLQSSSVAWDETTLILLSVLLSNRSQVLLGAMVLSYSSACVWTQLVRTDPPWDKCNTAWNALIVLVVFVL